MKRWLILGIMVIVTIMLCGCVSSVFETIPPPGKPATTVSSTIPPIEDGMPGSSLYNDSSWNFDNSDGWANEYWNEGIISKEIADSCIFNQSWDCAKKSLNDATVSVVTARIEWANASRFTSDPTEQAYVALKINATELCVEALHSDLEMVDEMGKESVNSSKISVINEQSRILYNKADSKYVEAEEIITNYYLSSQGVSGTTSTFNVSSL
jgi:hypothetical protein